MLLQRSRLAALDAKRQRPRLLNPWLIGPTFGLIALTLAVIYPRGDLIRRVMEAPQGLLTAAYLDNLLRTEPENPQLRLLLARNQMQAGEFDKVGVSLAPLNAASDAKLRREAAWLLWQSEFRRMEKQPENAKQRLHLREALRQRLEQFAGENWPPAERAQIALHAFALGDKALGIRLFKELSQSIGPEQPEWIVEGARAALANGEYRAAAGFYLLAAERADDLASERDLFLGALRSLVSGDLTPEALLLAENYLQRHPRLSGDREVLIELIKYARATQSRDLADKYARQLLRLSLLLQWQQEQQRLAHAGASFRKVNQQAEPGLPFDDKAYTLGFQAFLDNRKLEDAWKVAASAVRQAPEHLLWRERLAQVAEWSGRPVQALENWLYLARRTGRAEAWQAVLRLAPGLFDDRALLEALQRELGARPGDEKLIRELIAIHERLGDPAGALRFLERRLATQNQPWLLIEMAGVAERMGDDEAAIALWRRYLAREKPTAAIAVRAATLMLLRGHGEEALTVLQNASGAEDAPSAFWRLQGDAARQIGREPAAVAAYRRLVALPDAEERDYETLHTILAIDHPLEAARVAAAQWRRFGSATALLRALGGFDSRNAHSESERLMAEIPAAQLPALRRLPEFLRYSARLHAQRGKMLPARRDLELALALAPEDSQIRQAWLWLLIDLSDGATLLASLQANEGRWQGDTALHTALAAAWQILSRPQLALNRYLTPNLARHRNDFLWLMNYADALEQNGETDRAWQLRARLLREQSPRRQLLTSAGEPELERLRSAARARLVIAQQSGDRGLGALRQLLRQDRAAEGKVSPEAAIVATAWLQNAGEYSAERGWLWQQLARSAARPRWAEIAMALAENDREAAGRLLEEHAPALPRSDRINAAMRLGLVRQAQSDAYASQLDQPQDDEGQQSLREALLAHSDHAGGEYARREIDRLDENERSLRWHLAIAPDLALDIGEGRIARRQNDPQQPPLGINERFRTLALAWKHRDGNTRFGVERRDSLAAYTPLFIEHRQRFDDRLEWRAALGYQLPATDSSALRVAGMRDRLAFGLSYRASLRDTIDLEFNRENFATQTDTRVGSARHLLFEWRHALRLDPRDLEISAFWQRNRYDRRGPFNDPALLPLLPPGTPLDGTFFLPESYRYSGIRLSTDTRFASEYTHAWRPYASVARTWNSLLGKGYDLSLGIAGSVFGADHLRIGWNYGKGGSSTANRVRQLEITYRLHY